MNTRSSGVRLLSALQCCRCSVSPLRKDARCFSISTARNLPRISKSSISLPQTTKLKTVVTSSPPPPPPEPVSASNEHQTTPKPQKPSYFSDIYYDKDRQLKTRILKEQSEYLASTEEFFRTSPRFLYSAALLKDHPYNEHTPEVVLLGASNVGKSSFLNALVGKLGTARVGPRPGKTTLMNAYGVGPDPNIAKTKVSKGTPLPRHKLIVMDTPGYGFKSQSTWGEAIFNYLGSRKALCGAIVLLSSEKKLLAADKRIMRMLAETNTRTLMVLTKVDKAPNNWNTQGIDLVRSVHEELRKLERQSGTQWTEGSGWISDVYLTAAGMGGVPGRLGNGGGMGGVRSAILEMADIELDVAKTQNEAAESLENKSYDGRIVSFDDIQWKS